MAKKLKRLQRSILCLSSILFSCATFAATTDWNYSSSAGPKQWASLNSAYQLCATGLEQSPINISTVTSTQPLLAPVVFYNKYSQAWSLTRNHGAIEALVVNPDFKNYVQWQNKRYQLIQFHLHWPSETQLNGKNFPLELHFVNQNTDGSLAVVAVLFKTGKANPAIQIILNNMKNSKSVNFSIKDLLPKLTDFYNFKGSLTTPPCSQSVQWLVMEKPLELSSQQLEALKQYMTSSNARPTQPLHDRSIEKYISKAI